MVCGIAIKGDAFHRIRFARDKAIHEFFNEDDSKQYIQSEGVRHFARFKCHA